MKKRGMHKAFLLLLAVLCTSVLSSCARRAKSEPTDMLAYCTDEGLFLSDADGSNASLAVKGSHISKIFFSEDGRYIVYNNSNDVFFYDRDTDKSDFLTANARCVAFTGGKAVLLTATQGVLLADPALHTLETAIPQPKDGYISAVCPSPVEGTRFAYSVCYSDAGREYYKAFCIASSDTGDVLAFTPKEICGNPNGMPTPLFWSENGSTVIFSCPVSPGSPSMLYSLAIADSSPARLAGAKTFQLENGGLLSLTSYAAMSVSKVSASGSYIALIDRGDLSVSLLSTEAAPDALSVSPDGSTVSYSSDGSVYVSSSGRTLFICGGGYTSPNFSPDGLRIYSVFPGEDISLCRSNANSAGAEVIVSGLRSPDPYYDEEFADLYEFFYVK